MAETQTPQLFTSCYSHGRIIAESGLAAIRISVGFPRFKLAFELAGACRTLMPERAWLKLPQPQYWEHFRSKLEAAGVDAIQAELNAFSQAAGGRGLVLLCFEKLQTPGEWCHRTMFANWWLAKTGQQVQELAAAAKKPQPSLF